MKEKIKHIFGYLMGAILFASIAFQTFHYNQFIAKGPRFTAYDGQDLCERVKLLEEYEIKKGSDAISKNCNYTGNHK